MIDGLYTAASTYTIAPRLIFQTGLPGMGCDNPPASLFLLEGGVGGFGTTLTIINRTLLPSYRSYSNKRCGAYQIFRALNAALIRGRRLLEGGAYLKIGRDKEIFSFKLTVHFLSVRKLYSN